MSSKGLEDIVGTAAPTLETYGAVTAGAGAYNKSVADKAAFETQAAVAANNSQFAQMQASDADTRGQTAQMNSQLKTRQLQGNQAAIMAANGVDLATGSALDILTDTSFMGANDASVIAQNAAKEAWGYKVQESNEVSKANLYRQRASAENPGQAQRTSLLTSAGTVASRWYGARHSLSGVQ